MLSEHIRKTAALKKDSDANKLYQQALLVHHKKPCGFNQKIKITHSSEGDNPACGDEITVNVHVENDQIIALSFAGDSCAICRASASLMCQELVQVNLSEALLIENNIIESFTNSIEFTGAFTPLNSIFSLPIRQQCALLPWRTFHQALKTTNFEMS